MKKLSLRFLVILATIAIAVSMSVTPSVADVTVTNVTVSPESVEVGENVTITATVENTGNATEIVPIVFKINGEEVKSVNVTVEANATETVEYVIVEEEAGTYTVTVDSASASFTVTALPTPTPSPTPSRSPTPTPSPTATPDVTPTPTPTPTTPAGNSEEKFRVGPTVKLRPVIDVIDSSRDGIVELYMDNPSLNDVTLHADVRISVPAGIHIYGEGFGLAGAAGTVYGTFDVPPGTVRAVAVLIKADESARLGPYTLQFSGLYYPGDNKDLYNPILLTHPITVKEPSKKPESAEPSNPEDVSEGAEPPAKGVPGFEAMFALGAIAIVLLLLRRK